MKKISITLLLSALLAGNVFAADVNAPFMNKVVPQEGLTIAYNTQDSEKLVCVADNFYKGYLSITVNGAEKDTGIVYGDYGDGSEFYFTSVGSDKEIGDLDQFHVDKSGVVKFKDTNYKPHKATLSCFYTTETK